MSSLDRRSGDEQILVVFFIDADEHAVLPVDKHARLAIVDLLLGVEGLRNHCKQVKLEPGDEATFERWLVSSSSGNTSCDVRTAAGAISMALYSHGVRMDSRLGRRRLMCFAYSRCCNSDEFGEGV